MLFNLIPIPPLDGSSIFAFFMPEKYLPAYYRIQQYALPVFDLFAMDDFRPGLAPEKEYFCEDGLHPYNSGYRLIAERLIAFLRAL